MIHGGHGFLRRSITGCFLFFLLTISFPVKAAGPPVAGFADHVELLGPTVVNIYTTQTIRTGRGLQDFFPFQDREMPDMFKHFFNFPKSQEAPPQAETKRTSLGSGVIISKDGYVVTNNHVIEDADEIHVILSTSKEYAAKIIGKDPKTDLALLKIEAKEDLPAAVFGDSEKLRVGDWVIAIGNPFGLEQTVTAGIVSAKGRYIGNTQYEDFIQTDASINPGNSGGPLFDMDGKMVGINTAIFSRSGGNIGIGFAIPVNMAKVYIDQLKENGTIVRGWLGVRIQEVTSEIAEQFGIDRPVGALIGEIMPDSPAEKGGFRVGDVVIRFNDRSIDRWSMLPALVAQIPVGTEVTADIVRDGKEQRLTITIGRLDDEQGGQLSEAVSAWKLGMSVQQLDADLARTFNLENQQGVIITDVAQGSAADHAGLMRGDLILEVNKKKVIDLKTFEELLTSKDEKKSLLLLTMRDSHSRYVVLKIE